jgi:hypothetical protein
VAASGEREKKKEKKRKKEYFKSNVHLGLKATNEVRTCHLLSERNG